MIVIALVVFVIAIAVGSASKRLKGYSFSSGDYSGSNYRTWDDDDEEETRLRRRYYRSQIEREERIQDNQESRRQQKMWNDFWS